MSTLFVSYLRERRQNLSNGNPAESDVGCVDFHVLKRPQKISLILDKKAIYLSSKQLVIK